MHIFLYIHTVPWRRPFLSTCHFEESHTCIYIHTWGRSSQKSPLHTSMKFFHPVLFYTLVQMVPINVVVVYDRDIDSQWLFNRKSFQTRKPEVHVSMYCQCTPFIYPLIANIGESLSRLRSMHLPRGHLRKNWTFGWSYSCKTMTTIQKHMYLLNLCIAHRNPQSNVKQRCYCTRIVQ